MKQVTYIIMLNRVIPVVLRYLLKGRRAHRTAYILGHTEIIAGRPAVDPCGNRGCISTGRVVWTAEIVDCVVLPSMEFDNWNW